MCGSLLSKFREATDKVDPTETVSPDSMKLTDKDSSKNYCKVPRKDGDRNDEPRSVQSLASVLRKTLGVNASNSLTHEEIEESKKGVDGVSACYQEKGFEKDEESKIALSLAICSRNKSGLGILCSLLALEGSIRALNIASSSTKSKKDTGYPMERQKQEVEGGTYDLQDLETYVASNSDEHSWGD